MSSVNTIYTQTSRYRVNAASEISNKIKESWIPPQKGIVQWDGNLMETLDGSSKEERLPILLSGIGGIKLIGVPSLPHLSEDSTGSLIANATIKLLDEWSCRSSVIVMVFDTTSSNTWHKTAACIAVQRELDSSYYG